MAIISSLRRGKVVLWVRVPPTNNGALVAASPTTAVLHFLLFPLPLNFFESYYCIPFGLGNTGEYSVLRLCIAPPCSRANTAKYPRTEYSPALTSQSCNNIHFYKGQFQYPQGVCYSAHTITTRVRARILLLQRIRTPLYE